MRRTLKLAVLGILGLLATAAQASLTGSSVTGTLNFGTGGTNFFDPANNVGGTGVPATGYLNSGATPTVTISTTIPEYGFQDANNTIRADFGSSTLLINDVVLTFVTTTKYTFTDAAFAGQAITESSDTFPGGMTVNLLGTTVTINYAGTQTAGNYNAVFVIGPAVPEPACFTLTGATLLGLICRRRSA